MTSTQNVSSQPIAQPVSVVTLTDGNQLPQDALDLLSAAEQVSMQCGHPWYSILVQEVFPTPGQVQWMVLREAGRCTAVWPLLTGSLAGALSNYYTALYQPAHAAFVTPTGLKELAKALRTQRAGRGKLVFGPMDPETPEFMAMETALRASGYRTYRFFRFGNWYLPCAGVHWEQYFSDRKGAVRSTVRRMAKKLSADGGTLEIIFGGPRLQAGIDAYEHAYSSSWKQTEPYPGFIRALITTAAERGWLRLGVAWLDGQAIAAQLWIVAHGRAEIFKVAYNEAFKAYTAGTLLTAMLMEHVLDQDKVKEVDYLIGDDAYKKTWMSDRRERWGLVAYDPWSLVGFNGIVRSVGGRLLKRFRPKQPIVEKS